MFPSFNFKGNQQVLVYQNSGEVLDKVLTYHNVVHCVEIVTNSKNPDIPPQLPEFSHVLLKTKMFQDDDAVNTLFEPATIFQSLSPLGAGNTMYVRNSTVTFTLNQATYERFGLLGKEYEKIHYVTVKSDEREKMKLIKNGEAVEGLLYAEDTSTLDQFIKNSTPCPVEVDHWTSTKPLEMDVKLFATEESYPDDWKVQIVNAIDKSLLTRNQIEGNDEFKRITFTGPIQLSNLSDWLRGLAKDSFVLLMIWDFRDELASFVGNKLKMEGFGGGCESIVYGDQVARPFKIQTVEYVDEE